MTVREYVKRRTRLILAIGFGGWLLLPLSAIFSQGHDPPVPVFLVGGLVFGAAIFTMFFLNRCPKCRTPLGQIAGEIAFHWGTRRRVNFCPYCGVSMDAQYEAPHKVP
jgi:hypothetical protein